MKVLHLLIKDKAWLKCSVMLFASLISQQAYSETINVGYDNFNNPTLNVVTPSDGSVPFSALLNDWLFLYEDNNGTGTLSFNADLNTFGAVEINNSSVTTNHDGSLHVDGTINFIDLNTSGHFFGDMIVTANFDDSGQVTVFSFDPIAVNGLDFDGFLLMRGPLASLLLDFHVTSSLLAIVDNPFPTYSPVPIPAAFWLFGSGMIGLIGIARQKKS